MLANTLRKSTVNQPLTEMLEARAGVLLFIENKGIANFYSPFRGTLTRGAPERLANISFVTFADVASA